LNFISRKIALVLIALLLAVPALAAGKRRAAGKPANPSVNDSIRGTILDNANNQPVIGATVTVQGLSNKSDTTDAQGRFEIKKVPAGSYTLSISRTGYEPKNVTVSVSATGANVDTKLVSKPTVAVKLTNGTTVQIDSETVEFAYLVPFSGYARSEYARFCRGGAVFEPDRSEIKKISAIASAQNGDCCDTNPILKASLQLRTGETTDVFFIDSCPGYEVDFIGRNHVTGQFNYLKFTDISEIVFP
jgi:hypothetical protein